MPIWDRYVDSLGVLNLTWGNLVFLLVGAGALALALRRSWHGPELLPLALGVILANLPGTGLGTVGSGAEAPGFLGAFFRFGVTLSSILPPLLFLGLGATTDLGPLIARPRLLVIGGSVVLAILAGFWVAAATGLFSLGQAAAVGIAGAADGPLAVFAAARLSAQDQVLVATIGAAGYVGALLAATLQRSLLPRLTTRRERTIVMRRPREVSRAERLLGLLAALVLLLLLMPAAAPLAGMFLVGNLLRESGLLPRLTTTVGSELLNLLIVLLALVVGTQLSADRVFHLTTVAVLAIAAGTAVAGTVVGVLVVKGLNLVSQDKVNPLIGGAALAALPMASQTVAAEANKADPSNELLPHASAANAAALLAAVTIGAAFLATMS